MNGFSSLEQAAQAALESPCHVEVERDRKIVARAQAVLADQRIAVLFLEDHGPRREAERIGDSQAGAQDQRLAPEQVLAGLGGAVAPVGEALDGEPQGERETAREAAELTEIGVLVDGTEIEVHSDVARAFAEPRREGDPR